MSVNNYNTKHIDFQLFYAGFSDSFFENIPEPEVLAGFIVKNGINIVYSAGGVGKSHLSVAVSDYLSQKHNMYAFYIDFDNTVSAIKLRIWNNDFSGIMQTNKLFKYIHHSVNLSYFRDTFKDVFENRTDIEGLLELISLAVGDSDCIVVIDSLQNFVDINDIKQLSAFFSTLKKYNYTYLIIHHMNKANIYKGLTFIRDICDSMYHLKDAERNSGYIISHTLIADKRRYLTEDVIHIKYDGFRVKDIIDVAVDSDEEKYVLRVAVSILKTEIKLKQSELVSKIHDKLKTIGVNKILKIIQTYSDKGLFITSKGLKNATFFELNFESEYLSVLFDYSLSDVKRTALEIIKQLPENENLQIEVEAKDGIHIYTNKQLLIKAIYRFDDDVVVKLIDKLKEFVSVEDNEDDIVDF